MSERTLKNQNNLGGVLARVSTEARLVATHCGDPDVSNGKSSDAAARPAFM